MRIEDILKRPILTEKSLRLSKRNQYTFEVDKRARKAQVAQAVKDQFNVGVVSVVTMRIKGKKRRVGRLRREAKLANWKKAIVTLKPEEKIELFDVR